MTILEIILSLRDESKTNSKLKILKENKNNLVLTSLFWWTYNPTHNFNISKLNEFSLVGDKTFDTDFQLIKELLTDLVNKKYTGNSARSHIDYVLSQFTKEYQELFKLVLKRDLKCGVGVSLINKAFGKEFIPEFKVQLANKYDPKKKYSSTNWYVTPKMDGLRCFWTSNTPDILWSRSGKEFVGFESIVENLKIISDKEKIDFFDGELFSKEQDFCSIQGSIMSNVNYTKEDKEKVIYNIFALGYEKTIIPTIAMQSVISRLSKLNLFDNIRFIEAELIPNDKEIIEEYAKKYVEQGYEGAMLRHDTFSYDFKRSDLLLKVKFFKEMDLKIVEIQEGQGKYEGTLGSLKCTSDDGLISVDVGTGFSDNLRKHFWSNKDNFIGSLVEVKYQEESQDKEGNKSLRFPVFSKLKF